MSNEFEEVVNESLTLKEYVPALEWRTVRERLTKRMERGLQSDKRIYFAQLNSLVIAQRFIDVFIYEGSNSIQKIRQCPKD